MTPSTASSPSQPEPDSQPARQPQPRPVAGRTWTVSQIAARVQRTTFQLQSAAKAQPDRSADHEPETVTAQAEPDSTTAPQKPGPVAKTTHSARRPRTGYRSPEYIVVVAISSQLRSQHPEMPLSLDEALRLGPEHPGRDHASEPDWEAEP